MSVHTFSDDPHVVDLSLLHLLQLLEVLEEDSERGNGGVFVPQTLQGLHGEGEVDLRGGLHLVDGQRELVLRSRPADQNVLQVHHFLCRVVLQNKGMYNFHKKIN